MIVAWSSRGGITTPDHMKWLECNGQVFDTDKYSELYAVLGVNRVPSLNGQFLRGTTVADAVLTYKEDTIKSHQSTVAPHEHKISGTGTTEGTISGTAGGQTYSTNADLDVTGTAAGQKFTSDAANLNVSSTFNTGSVVKSISTTSAEGSMTGTGYPKVNGRIDPTNLKLNDQPYRCTTNSKGNVQVCYAYSGSDGNDVAFTIIKDSSSSSTGSTTTSTTAISKVTANTGTLSGTATGKATGTISGTANSSAITGSAKGLISGTANPSTVTGRYSGSVDPGTMKSVQSDTLTATYEGAEETAPKHTFVRYFIRAIP